MIPIEPTAENLKCCGNCANHDVADGGTLQCNFQEHLSSYNNATCPSGICDKWKYDNTTREKRLHYIENSCEETTPKK